jgi:putative ABC transport system substrate-binding protein
MIKRTAYLVMALAIWAAALPAAAQTAGKVPRIGFLHPGSFANSTRVPPFLRGLRDFGYVEGRNIRIEWRFADGNRARLPALAADLVRLKVDVIVCPGGAAPAAMAATSTIPIVITVAPDYVAMGWVESHARPGGNVTGLSNLAKDVMAKQLQLFKEVVPGLRRVAIVNADLPGHAIQVREAKEAAAGLDLDIVPIRVGAAADLAPAFARMKAKRVDGIVVLRLGLFMHLRDDMTARALEAGLPSLYGHRVEAQAGGLMAYGADTKALYRGAGSYVDKILKGADPGELPISQATTFDFVINLKTAKALGITVPRSILIRATEIIE